MSIYAVDTETYYKVKTFGIGELGIYHYLRSEESDIYLVSIVGDDGLRFVGHPKDAPWDAINKPDAVWLSHNAGFDQPVFECLQELGHAPKDINIAAWWCTADLTAYLGLPRSLKEASRYLLGKTISKDVRDKMSGKRWETMTPEFQKEVMDYALNDSEDCLNIWLKHGHKWPHHERLTSFFTRQMAYYGVPVDTVAAQAAVTKLETAIWEAEALIPWAGKEKTLSATTIRTECATQSIWCPDSFAKDAPDVERWENEFSERFPWIKAVRNYRRSNKHLATAKSMLNRTRPDGRMAYGLKYFGAHTGRDSGSEGVNVQNFPRGEICGVDLRSLIKAPEGKTFVICDLSAIEPRVLAWLCKDTKTLGLLASGLDVYEAHARATMGYSDPRPLKEVNPGMRKLAKARILGLGYGCGKVKFQAVAKILANLDLTAQECEKTVNEFRAQNPKIVRFWGALENNLRTTLSTQGEKDAHFVLPSGRSVTYRNVNSSGKGLSVELPKKGKLVRLGIWGGVICENCVSAETEVLTPSGWKRIVEVLQDDRVWDGEEWVSHSGVRASGLQETIVCHGVRATPEHLFLGEEGWVRADLACQAACITPKLPPYESSTTQGYTGARVRKLEGDRVCGIEREKLSVESAVQMRYGDDKTCKGLNPKGRDSILREEMYSFQRGGGAQKYNARVESPSRVCCMEVNQSEVSQPKPRIFSSVRGAWGNGLRSVEGVFRGVLERYARRLFTGARYRSDRQQRGVLEGELPLGYSIAEQSEHTSSVGESFRPARKLFGDSLSARHKTHDFVLPAKPWGVVGNDTRDEGRRKEPVFDLLNCGPRQRFVARGGAEHPAVVVHNCTQALARDVFMYHCLKLTQEGLAPIMRVHDEVVIEVDLDKAEATLKHVEELMSTPPEWASDLPLGAEAKISNVYTK
jgi:hypothetical protein